MDDQVTPALAQSSAVRAFEELRGEVSLLRLALQGLTAQGQAVPDYSPTLADIDRRLHAVCEWARKISDCPGIKLTPERLATEIERASVAARRADAAALAEARSALEQEACRLDAIVRRGRLAADQRRWLVGSGLFCILIGVTLGVLVG
jgi:hypothetical protein